MPDGDLVKIRRRCVNPDIGAFLADYCFEAMADAHKGRFEAHLLECDACWDEVQKLTKAVSLLRQDRALAKSITAGDLARAFGPSARLEALPIAGHRSHAVIASTLYSLYFVAILLTEVAYQWDRLGLKALVAAPIVLVSMFCASWWLLRSTTEAERRNQRIRTVVLLARLLLPIAFIFAFVCFAVLPGENVTLDQTTGWTARIAYFKGIVYMLPIAVFFFALPFRAVAAVQGDLRDGKHKEMLAFLSRDRHAVPPDDTLFVSPRSLWVAITAAFLVNIPMTWHLLDTLQPSPYKAFFVVLIFVRITLYFAFALTCLLWYESALIELKREAITLLDETENTRP